MRMTGSKSKLEDFGDLFQPEEAAEPILARPVRDALTAWLTEIWAEDALAKVGVKARRKAIFDGPPGGGKTTLAHHLAARLGLPMLAVRPDRLLSKWVNETSENVGALFEAAQALGEPLVLFIDEFDSIAPKRQEVRQSADQGRNDMVNTLLQRLEQHQGFLIAATNHADRIDTAIWRRFDIHITLDLPGQDERLRILERYLAPFGLPERALEELGRSTDTASPALLRAFCENLKRQIIVDPLLKLDTGKVATFERLVAGCHPHPDLGKPRLWSHGGQDRAVAMLPWPLPLASDVAALAAEGDPVMDATDGKPWGLAAFNAGDPITANPYPFRDARRAEWDAGWREASGSDGMGGAEVVPFNGGRP